MPAYVALLRAVNVGGTGRLPMAELTALGREAGFQNVSTYITSGNLIFQSRLPEAKVRAALAERLAACVGRPVGVLVRSAEELAGIVARNPFPGEPGHRVMVLFTDEPLPPDPRAGVAGRQEERIVAGRREFLVFYPQGQARSRLRIPAAAAGTARNMNTVAKLAALAGALASAAPAA
ncbi:MAG: DUF1697 domain-containing protein [Deltaproteobacteria bacterium]|nr:DUF1697 domain-containing protein [Deltaproteobacteria bacterium]